MQEVYGSIWIHFMVANHFVCITTNGTVKKNGDAVMGRGNAKQAAICVPGIPKLLGAYLRQHGNVAGSLQVTNDDWPIIVFPVKHNWWEEADRKLILKSCAWLVAEAERNPSNTYHLPRPGCGNGKLDWEKDVRRLVSDLPDNVWVHHIDNVEMNTGE
jgi:hypothetical protein